MKRGVFIDYLIPEGSREQGQAASKMPAELNMKSDGVSERVKENGSERD